MKLLAAYSMDVRNAWTRRSPSCVFSCGSSAPISIPPIWFGPGIASSVLLATLLALLVGSVPPVSAQQVNGGSETGIPIYGSFQEGQMDTINVQNGNLHLVIPMTSIRERGRSFTWSYLYDTPSYEVLWVPQPTKTDPANGSYRVTPTQDVDWRLSTPLTWSIGYVGPTIATCSTSGLSYTYYTQYYVQDPEGTKHQVPVGWEYSNVCYNPQHSGPATDGSGITLSLTSATAGTVRLKDGTQIAVGTAVSWTDANGNLATASADMLNRNVVSTNSSPYPLGTSTLLDSNGHTQTYQTQSSTYTIQTSFCSVNHSRYPCSEYSTQITKPTKITLPTGLFYQFTYQNSALTQLTQITLPTGGAIAYTYNTTPATICVTQPNNTRTPSYICRAAVATRTVTDSTGGHQWTYSGGTVTDPAGNQQVHTFANIIVNQVVSNSVVETGVAYYQGTATSGKLLKSVSKTWTGEILDLDAYSSQFIGNLRVISETTTLDNNQQTQVQTDYETFTSNGSTFTRMNPTERREYAFGSGAPGAIVRRTDYAYLHTSNQTYVNLNIVDRMTSVVIHDGSGNVVAQTTNEFDNYTQGIQGTSAAQHSSSFGSSYTTRGNITATQRWRNTNGSWLTTRNQYNDVGDVISIADPNGYVTSYDYTDVWANSACSPSGAGLAYATKITDAASEVTKHAFYACTGLSASTTDPNNQVSSTTYDGMSRPLTVSFPDTGETTNCYTDDPSGACYSSSFPLEVNTSKRIKAGTNLTTTTVYDQLGRVSQTQLTSDPIGTVFTDTTYDSVGHVASVSNPYRTKTDSTYGVTSFLYDGLNRKTQVTEADGALSVVTTQYCGPTTMVKDEAGHWRRSTTDALGRLTEVDEPNSTTANVNVCPGTGEPIWVTSYTYDTLNNLLSVVQGGSRNRSFSYNSLNELLKSTNPESGSICYGTVSSGACQNNGYDNDGNLIYKTDARSITTTFAYDNVNRLKSRTYSNGDPTVTYTYSGTSCLGLASCYNVGRRTSMTDAAGTESFAYDTMGRQWAELRTSNGITKSTTYLYDLLGNLTALTYPSGRTITYSYDTAVRPLSAVDQANGTNYALNATYAPQGTLASVALGGASGVNLTHIYNSRLQPCWLYVTTGTALSPSTACTATDPGSGNILDLQYNFNIGAGDNGNVIGITNKRDNTRTQSFSYDQVNRIVTAQTVATSGSNCWGETFTYDQWANLTAKGALTGYGSCTQESLSVAATTNNQLSFTGSSYDASGNMLNDGINSYGWNAESEIKTAAGVNYTYDGDGNRVEKSNGKLYWYGAGTEILDESDLSGNFTNEYVFFGGARIAMRNVTSGTVYYYAEDFLGSSRTIVQAGGTSPCYDADFYPFGGERIITNTCPQNYKFEGKERDTETNNDDFGARYYSSRLGRWMSSDWSSVPAAIPYANLSNPQTLNLYGMVSDNPETFSDLDGHLQTTSCPSISGENPCAAPADEEGAPANVALGATQPTSTESCQPSPGGTCVSTGQAQQVSTDQEKAQNRAQNQVTILGNTVTVTYAQGMSDKDRAAAYGKVADAAAIINSKADQLTDSEKATIGNVKTIDVDPKASRSSVDPQSGTYHVNAGQLAEGTVRFASDLAHDSFHITQWKQGLTNTGAEAERHATYFEIQVGGKFGLSQNEVKFLKDYADNIDKSKGYWNSPVTH